MEDLKELTRTLEKRLDRIRRIRNKTLSDRQEYEETQKQLREIYNVTIYVAKMKRGEIR